MGRPSSGDGRIPGVGAKGFVDVADDMTLSSPRWLMDEEGLRDELDERPMLRFRKDIMNFLWRLE